MSFLFPSLLWIGLPLIVVPIVIHLLHPGRQERIPWAAMHFLIESQRKYQRWINLKQLLLLLTRIAIIAGIALYVAQPLLRTNWAAIISPRAVHHVVLLDDSFSMTDRDSDGSAWSSGLAVLDRLIVNSAGHSTSTVLSVIRFSQTMHADDRNNEYFEAAVTAESAEQLRAQIASWKFSQTDAKIAAALSVGMEYLNRQSASSDIVLHVLSDFRRRDWQDASSISKQLETLASKVSKIELVQCAQRSHDNLAITELAVDAGVEAADVEVWFRIGVRNFGKQRAERVAVDVTQDGRPQTAISIGDIAAGESVTKRFRATFVGKGDHWLAAQIEPDAVELDNARYYAAKLPERKQVLLVDGSHDGEEALFLAIALAPGGRAQTGWEVVTQTPSGLTRYEDFSRFAAIALLSVSRLTNEAIDKLESYVRAGGGVWITVDDTVDRGFYNDNLYRDGTGLLALPLKFPSELEPGDQHEADLVMSSHPAVRVFGGLRNDFLKVAAVQVFYETRGEQGAVPEEIGILATLRNGAPWMVEKRFGRGAAITQFGRLSSLPTRAGRWSNIATNPAFPVLANEITAYLARNGANQPLFRVGEKLSVSEAPVRGVALSRIAALPNESLDQSTSPMDAGGGLRESGLFRIEGQEGTAARLLAVNVDPYEGDLASLSHEDLISRLEGLDSKIGIWMADELTVPSENASAGRLGDVLLILVLGLLAGEQALAYWTSYHRRSTAGAAL